MSHKPRPFYCHETSVIVRYSHNFGEFVSGSHIHDSVGYARDGRDPRQCPRRHPTRASAKRQRYLDDEAPRSAPPLHRDTSPTIYLFLSASSLALQFISFHLISHHSSDSQPYHIHLYTLEEYTRCTRSPTDSRFWRRPRLGYLIFSSAPDTARWLGSIM